MKTIRFNFCAAVFAVLMSVSLVNAQVELAAEGLKFAVSIYIKNKEAREKISEIQSTYEDWTKKIKDYSKKHGKVADCKTLGLVGFHNNSDETKSFSYVCGVRDDGNVAYLQVKNPSKIGDCPEKSTYEMSFDIREQYFKTASRPEKDACVFFEVPCNLRYIGSCPAGTKTFVSGRTMEFVSGGKFEMGLAISGGMYGGQGNESPARTVKVDGFCIGRYPVTQNDWSEIMGSNPSHFKDKCSSCPVEQVSWNDAQEYIRKLNAKTKMNYRLLTEAEWEYAAKGGCKSKNYKYSGSNDPNKVAWYTKNSNNKTNTNSLTGGNKTSNELFISEMSGNVWEWVNDWYGKYNSSDTKNPKGPNTGSDRVVRGGSWNSTADRCEVSARTFAPPNDRKNFIGLRLAHPPLPPSESSSE